MTTVTIAREPSQDYGTFGKLVAPGPNCVFECVTLELPWRDNRRNVSCIPEGRYRVEWSRSGRFGEVYRVLDVPGRSGILIHPGNWAGDRFMRMMSDVEGCILLGAKRSIIANQPAVSASRATVRRFAEFMGRRPFHIQLIDAGS